MKAAFVGHRKIEISERLKERVGNTVIALIEGGTDTFLFGSRSDFDELCYDTVTKLKARYPHIRRVYVRAEYEHIDESYRKYLAQSYEDTFYPDEARGAGALSYIKRNRAMIDMCDVAVVYYDKNYAPECANSGTALAVKYAIQRKKRIINLFVESE